MTQKNGVLLRVLRRLRGGARRRPGPALAAALQRARAHAAGRRVVALQLPAFDRGGLEEVVLSLARHLPQHTDLCPVVLVGSGRCGHLAAAAQAHGVPVVPLDGDAAALQHVMDALDVAVVNTHYDTLGLQEWAARGVPIVYTIQNVYVWATDAYVAERRAAYARVAAFVAVSDHVADFHARRFDLPRERITTVANGVDTRPFTAATPAARDELGVPVDAPLFVNVASFNWNKFQVALVLAAERLRDAGVRAHVLVVGNVHDPACHALVRDQIAARGLDDMVTLLDYVTKERIAGILAASDCFVMPSIVEGCSNAAVEALAAGLPLVMSDVGGARMLLGDAAFGHLIPNVADPLAVCDAGFAERTNRALDPPNLDDLVEAMRDVAARPAEWRERARAGRAHVEAGFSATAMCRGYADVFAALVGK